MIPNSTRPDGSGHGSKTAPDQNQWYMDARVGAKRLADTHLCVLTDSGATRRPRVPLPKSTSKNHRILGVCKRK